MTVLTWIGDHWLFVLVLVLIVLNGIEDLIRVWRNPTDV
jgi:hypothetical protein